jgi:hypothetical protein
MIAERIDRNSAHFGIFTANVILRDERLNFVTHRLVDSHLSRDCSSTRGFRTTTGFHQRTTITRSDGTHFRRALAFGERTAETSLACSNRIRLLTRCERSLTTYVAR